MKALGWFWAGLGVVVLAGMGVLQYLGPPPHSRVKPPMAPPAAEAAPPQAAAGAPVANTELVAPQPAAPPSGAATEAPATAAVSEQAAPVAPIRGPDTALLESAPNYSYAKLPRVASDGRKAMDNYAAAFNRADSRPRVAIVLGGIGQSESDSEDASSVLPPAVSFVISPYAVRPEKLLDDLRAHGHEFLIGLPMEPANNPVNSEGNFQMMTGSMQEQNARNLEWAMSRIQGYVGTTNAMDGLRGERFSGSSQQMLPVLQEIARRGVFYVDAVPGNNHLALSAVPTLVSHSVDIVLDEPAVRAEIDLRLTQLEQIARDRGAAIGLAGLPRPMTISRIAAWAGGLSARGVALAPVSVIARFPPPVTTAQKAPPPASPSAPLPAPRPAASR